MSSLIADIVVIAVILLAVSLACVHLYKEKKRGSYCSACSMAGSCDHRGIKEIKKTEVPFC